MTADAEPLDAAIDRLFTDPPRAFIATRAALVKELRAAGATEGAAAIAAMRKPTPTAWALDWIAREHPDAIRAYVEAAEGVRAAQRDAVHGRGTAGFEGARKKLAEHEARVMRLAREGVARAGTKWTAQTQRRIAQSLHAVPFASEEERAALVKGRLAVDLDAETDFGALAESVGARHRASPPASASASTSASMSTPAEAKAKAKAKAKAAAEAAKAAAKERAAQRRRETTARKLEARAAELASAATTREREAAKARDAAERAGAAARQAREAAEKGRG